MSICLDHPGGPPGPRPSREPVDRPEDGGIHLLPVLVATLSPPPPSWCSSLRASSWSGTTSSHTTGWSRASNLDPKGDGHRLFLRRLTFAWGLFFLRAPLVGAEGETLLDMELRVRYYYRDKRPGKKWSSRAIRTPLPPTRWIGPPTFTCTTWTTGSGRGSSIPPPIPGQVLAARDSSGAASTLFRPADELRWGWNPIGHQWCPSL